MIKPIGFRITNFRSIVDTGHFSLSTDNITALIGQNESGKSSVLEALLAFYTDEISEDDLRSAYEYPSVTCTYQIDDAEVAQLGLEEGTIGGHLRNLLKAAGQRVEITRSWRDIDESYLVLQDSFRDALITVRASEGLNDRELAQVNSPQTPAKSSAGVSQRAEATEAIEEVYQTNRTKDQAAMIVTLDLLAEKIVQSGPVFTLFKDFDSLLPDSIDVEDLKATKSKAGGIRGVKNLLRIAELSIEAFTEMPQRLKEAKQESCNKRVTADFRRFWKQRIGSEQQVSIELSLRNYSESAPTPGAEYLLFWINDGDQKLYLKQRSKGLRWFLSFYLELCATRGQAGSRGHFLLVDEPGGSLHARAQEDVLRVFQEISSSTQIVYTTHSPFLVDIKHLYRLVAVQRESAAALTDTKLIPYYKLAAASTDTLTPLSVALGADLSSQTIIGKENNVILEEVSAFYYLTAFKHLLKVDRDLNFFPTSGADHVATYANLFLGWRLQFVVLLDDDAKGRSVEKRLTSELFGGDERRAKGQILRITDCLGIEDLFTVTDFKRHVLSDQAAEVSSPNSTFMSKQGASKAVYAHKLLVRVLSGDLKAEDFNKETIKGFTKTMERIVDALSQLAVKNP